MENLLAPWPWYVSGPLIASVMALLILMGKRFGMSSNLETLCTLGGAGRWIDHFKTDPGPKRWGLYTALGAAIGGFIGANFLSSSDAVAIAPSAVERLQAQGFADAGSAYLPERFFGSAAWADPYAWAVLLVGGFLVGFGARYAGGCTSGHAISGLSDLQWPSLVAVVGFFLGGLITVHLLFPILFSAA